MWCAQIGCESPSCLILFLLIVKEKEMLLMFKLHRKHTAHSSLSSHTKHTAQINTLPYTTSSQLKFNIQRCIKSRNCAVWKSEWNWDKKSQSATRIKTPTSKDRLKTNLWEKEWKQFFLLSVLLTACPDVLLCAPERIKMHLIRKVGGRLYSVVVCRWGNWAKAYQSFPQK